MRLLRLAMLVLMLLTPSCARRPAVKEQHPEEQIQKVDKTLLEHQESKAAEDSLKKGENK